MRDPVPLMEIGSSAIAGLRGKENIDVFILFPFGRVSSVQEKQMTTVLDANVHNVAITVTIKLRLSVMG